MFDALSAELHRQLADLREEMQPLLEIISDDRNKPVTIGMKRQSLIEQARGEFVAFIDDDDWVDGLYAAEIMKCLIPNRASEGKEQKWNSINPPDAIGFGGHMSKDGIFDRTFRISAEYEYSQDAQNYYRYFNHLSPIRREIALQIGYCNAMFGEDFDYSMRLRKSGLVKSFIYIDKDMYHYRFSYKNSETQNPATR
jgi:glycosyltransferase involved in cell wall biosynthesis